MRALVDAAGLGLPILLALGASRTRRQSGMRRGDRGRTLIVYSGREEEIVEPLFERFEKETGIAVDVRYGDSAELAATAGRRRRQQLRRTSFSPRTPARSGPSRTTGLARASGRVARSREGRATATPTGAGSEPPAAFGWWRTTPTSYRRPTCPTVGSRASRTQSGARRSVMPPTNASFQAFVTAMRLSVGEDAARAWLRALKDNGAKLTRRTSRSSRRSRAGRSRSAW